MEIKHITRLTWDDLPSMEIPFFARSAIERDYAAGTSGFYRITGLGEALRDYARWYSPYGSQTDSRDALKWLLDRVDNGEYVLVRTDSSWTAPMDSVLRWSTEDNRKGHPVPRPGDKAIGDLEGCWMADPGLPTLMYLGINECLEKARRSDKLECRAPEPQWWGGLLDGRRWRGGKADAPEVDEPKLSSAKKQPPAKDKPQEPVKKADALSEAQILFNELANDNNIPFDYPRDCCFARAHEMCRQLEAKGIECGKTWYYSAGWPAQGSPDFPPANLSVTGLPKTPVIPDGTLSWTYHVAPTVELDGKTMVFDPSMFKGPVTPDEWRSKMVNKAPHLGDPVIINPA